MPSRKYQVKINDQDKDLELSWEGFFKKITLSLEGEIIGETTDKKAIRKGINFDHHLGRFSVRQITQGFTQDFDIRFNDEPVGGSAKDPMAKVKAGLGMTIALSILNLLVGSTAEIWSIQALLNMGMGAYNILIGCLYLICWISGKYFNRFAALLGATSIFLFDTVMALNLVQGIIPQNIGGTVVMRVIFGTPIVLGLIAAFKNRKSIVEDGALKYDERDED